jgi:hypothetical protein
VIPYLFTTLCKCLFFSLLTRLSFALTLLPLSIRTALDPILFVLRSARFIDLSRYSTMTSAAAASAAASAAPITTATATSTSTSKKTTTTTTSPSSATAPKQQAQAQAQAQNAWSKPLQAAAKPSSGAGGTAGTAGASSNSNSNSNVSDGNNNSHKRTPTAALASKDSHHSNSKDGTVAANRERFLHLLLQTVGTKCTVTLTNGHALTGLFHTATPFTVHNESLANKYVIKAVSQTSDETMYAIGSTVVLDMGQVATLNVKSIRLEAADRVGAGKAAANDVRTDVEISAAAAAGGGGNKAGSRQLEQASSAWTSATNSRADMLLEDGNSNSNSNSNSNRNKTAPLKGSIDGWDQFKANEQLFNVKGSYDENLYTTALDKTQMTSRKIKEAERIAREIETSVSTNMHVAEERGHVVEGDYDEEDLYSGVLKPKDQGGTVGAGGITKSQKVMNYAAAAAAKADTVPPGFNKTAAASETPAAATTKTNKADANGKATEENAPAAKNEPKATTADTNKVEEKAATGTAEESKKQQEEKKADAPKSKLSATAKSFSLNIKAKEWTPTFGTPATEQPPPPPGADPATGMPMAGGNPMQQSHPPPHYPQPGMGQPGTL